MPGPNAIWIGEQLDVSVYLAADPLSVLPSLGTFDVITMWHSWEHLRNPWCVLDCAATALSDGGVLIVASPNPTSLQARILGVRWTHLDSSRTALLRVPSAIVPATWNILINPRHPESVQVRVVRTHSHGLDPRLLR